MCRGREQPVSGAPGLVRLRICEPYRGGGGLRGPRGRVRLRICDLYRVRLRKSAPYRAALLHPLENQIAGPILEGVVLVKVDMGARGLLS